MPIAFAIFLSPYFIPRKKFHYIQVDNLILLKNVILKIFMSIKIKNYFDNY